MRVEKTCVQVFRKKGSEKYLENALKADDRRLESFVLTKLLPIPELVRDVSAMLKREGLLEVCLEDKLSNAGTFYGKMQDVVEQTMSEESSKMFRRVKKFRKYWRGRPNRIRRSVCK